MSVLTSDRNLLIETKVSVHFLNEIKRRGFCENNENSFFIDVSELYNEETGTYVDRVLFSEPKRAPSIRFLSRNYFGSKSLDDYIYLEGMIIYINGVWAKIINKS